jgi:hypothetical protein
MGSGHRHAEATPSPTASAASSSGAPNSTGERSRNWPTQSATAFSGRFRFLQRQVTWRQAGLAQVKIRKSTVIDAPVNAVWNLLRDFRQSGGIRSSPSDRRRARADEIGCVRRRLSGANR